MICNTVRSTLLRRMIGLQITSKSFTQSRNVINFIKTNLNRSQIKLSYCDRAKSNIIKMTDDNLPTNSLTNDCNTGKDGNATIQSCLDCPECVIGMQTIDRDSFNKKITIPTITVKRKDINLLVKMLKKYLFKVTFIKPIVQQGNIGIN